MEQLAQKTIVKMHAALADDLNTAEALAAIFDMVREANAAGDAGQVHQGDVPPLLAALAKFDEIFAVMQDDDVDKVRHVLGWAEAEGRGAEISVEASELARAAELSDAQVEALIAERNAARRARDFARSDAVRSQLAQAGIILEDTKDGVRWKRK